MSKGVQSTEKMLVNGTDLTAIGELGLFSISIIYKCTKDEKIKCGFNLHLMEIEKSIVLFNKTQNKAGLSSIYLHAQ